MPLINIYAQLCIEIYSSFLNYPQLQLLYMIFSPLFIYYKAIFKVISVFCMNAFSSLCLLGMCVMDKGSIIHPG